MTLFPRLRLESFWTPEAGGVYRLELTNAGPDPIEGFSLCVSGPARIGPDAEIEGASLDHRLSNHARLVPPEGFVLEAGARWTVTVRNGHALHHWTDGAAAAYVIGADDAVLPVATAPTRMIGENYPPLRGAARLVVPETAPVPISVVPWPNSVSVGHARTVPAGLDPEAASPAAQAATDAFAHLAGTLFAAEGMVRTAAEGGMPVRLSEKPGLGPEAYEIGFSPEAATIEAADHSGFLYGLVTLGQVWRGARQHPGVFVFPAGGRIVDAPGLSWRGTHLDVARRFYARAEIEKFLAILAWNKMNRFHWHLSDDEAWRIEIDAFPELTETAAWRGQGLALPPLLGSGPERTGGYYTKPAVRGIVALAERLGITIVPEIDMPGHCHAVLAALPHLRDPGETGTYQSVQGFPNNCLNPAHEPTYDFATTVIDELLDLFPARIVHVGADEVPLAAWSGSPLALARLEVVGGPEIAKSHAALLDTIGNRHGLDPIEGTGAALLQGEFLARLQAHVAAKGGITGGWEEAGYGDAIEKSAAYLVGWRDVKAAAELAGRGYDVVVAPGQHYYLDMALAPDWSEPGASWAGSSSLQETYGFEPRAGWSENQLAHLLGVQSCIWSEPMGDRAVFDRLVFPRLSAVAETGWTLPENKSHARFVALVGLMPVLYGHWAE